MDPLTDYPAAFQFLGGYLHQDWPEDYGTECAAVTAAIGDFRESGRLRDVVRNLDLLLALVDADLDAAVRQLCDYRASGSTNRS